MRSRKEWCPTCLRVSAMTPLGVCCRCDTIVNLEPDLKRVPRLMTDETVMKAIELYFRRGLSLRQTASVVFPETEYAAEWSCAEGIRRQFIHKGLKLRDRSQSQTLRQRRPR